MRILHALSQTELTGSEVYAWELAHHQARAGHEIFVVSDRTHKDFPGTSWLLPLSTGSFWRRMGNIFRLRRFLLQQKIDVVHCHSRGACRHLHWALRGLPIPMVTTIHGRQHASLSKRLFDIYGDIVIAVCERIGEQLTNEFKMDPHKVLILRNPVARPQVSPAETEGPVVSLLGRASGPKGERLIRLVREEGEKWRTETPGIKIRLYLGGLDDVTAGKLRRELPAEVHGTVPDLKPVLQSSSAVIASGRIAIEALLLGRPVLAFGESKFVGAVTEATWKENLATNFGDVGPQEPTDFGKVSEDLRKVLKNPEIFPIEVVEETFSPKMIQERIEDLYKGVRLYKKASWIPILMYHKVLTNPIPTQHRTFVLVKRFARHLRFFRWRGLTPLTFKELADFWHGRRPLSEFPRRPLLLTFDDGYKNNETLALPLLKQYRMKASLFALADPQVSFNEWDEREGEPREDLLSAGDLQRLPAEVIEVGSHGFRHEKLTEKTTEEVRSELRNSKETLTRHLGRDVCVFAYPYGAIDERLPELAKEAGYEFAVNTDRGPVLWFLNRWSLFRVNIFPEDNEWTLWKKTSPWYRRYYWKKRGY